MLRPLFYPAGPVACHCCGLVQTAPDLPLGSRALCGRCGSIVRDPQRRALSSSRAAAASIAGLLLYPFAVGLPIMTVEQFGHSHVSSIWGGTWQLLGQGEFFVGLVVLLCSIVLPLFKLLGLLALTAFSPAISRRWRAQTYRLIEWTGRWGMLDVLLIALLVAWVKVGDLVQVSAGPAALTFTLVVICSLLASAWFDPHAIWDDHPQGDPAS